MAKKARPWSGRFEEPVDERVKRFTASASFDKRLAMGADDPFTRYYMASLHALWDEAEQARRHLDLPLEKLPVFTRWRVPRDPDFDSVRASPLFAEL